MITKINLKRTPMSQDVKFFKRMESEALLAYRHITKRLIKEIIYLLRDEKLAKSDNDNTPKLPKGWTGSVNKITIDLNDKIVPLIDRYLKGFNWILFGDMADKESRKIAKELKLSRLFVPGSAVASYLHAIDSNREFYKDIYGEDPGFPKQLIKESMESIPEVSSIAMSQSFMNVKTGLLLALNNIVDAHNNNNLNDAFEQLHDLPEADKIEAKRIGENLDNFISSTRIEIDMRRAARRLERPFVLSAQHTIVSANTLGTHQSMHEIYASRDDDFDVIFVNSGLENMCKFCAPKSKNPDGTYIIYKMKDFKPAGYNYGRKMKEWNLQWGRQHPNCYCSQVVKPRGWKIDDDTLVKGG